MKRFAILFVLLVAFGVAANGQVKSNKCILTPVNGTVEDGNLNFANGDVKISIWSTLSPFWDFRIYNQEDREIVVDWNKSYITVNGETSKMLLGDTKVVNEGLTYPDETIGPNSRIGKKIMPTSYYKIGVPVNNRKFVESYKKSKGKDTDYKIVIFYSGGSSDNIEAHVVISAL